MQYQPTRHDAPESPASLQFHQLYRPMPMPPVRRRPQWGAIALIVISVVICAALAINITINILRVVVVPEVHATLATGTTATLKTTHNEIVAITIVSVGMTNAVFPPPPVQPGYSPYTINVSVQDSRTSDSAGASMWTAVGSDGKTYQGPGISQLVLVRRGGPPVPAMNPTPPPVLVMPVTFDLPSGVTVRSVVCSLPSNFLGGVVQTSEGRLHFDAP